MKNHKHGKETAWHWLYTIHAVEVRRNREIKWRKKINVYPIFEVYGWKEERNKKYRYNEWFNKNKREIEK